MSKAAQAPTQEQFEALLRERFGVEDFPKDAPPVLALGAHHELAEVLNERGYRIYAFVVGSHWLAVPGKKEDDPGTLEHYEVATGVRTIGPNSHLALWRVSVPMDGAIDSLVDLYAGADWQEREQYDLVGVRFANHPDLRRLMMPEDWDGHPLRKDYAIDTACPPWR